MKQNAGYFILKNILALWISENYLLALQKYNHHTQKNE